MLAHHAVPPQSFVTAQDVACVVERVVSKPRGLLWECQVGATLVGAIVKRNGKVLCTIEGTYSGKTGCWTYTLCGEAFEECTR